MSAKRYKGTVAKEKLSLLGCRKHRPRDLMTRRGLLTIKAGIKTFAKRFVYNRNTKPASGEESCQRKMRSAVLSNQPRLLDCERSGAGSGCRTLARGCEQIGVPCKWLSVKKKICNLGCNWVERFAPQK